MSLFKINFFLDANPSRSHRLWHKLKIRSSTFYVPAQNQLLISVGNIYIYKRFAICSLTSAVLQLLHKPSELNIAIKQPWHNLKPMLFSSPDLPCVNVPATSKSSERTSRGNFMLAAALQSCRLLLNSFQRVPATFFHICLPTLLCAPAAGLRHWLNPPRCPVSA